MTPVTNILANEDRAINFVAVRDTEGNISRVRLDSLCRFSILPLKNDCLGMKYVLQVERQGQVFKAGRYKDLSTAEQAFRRLRAHL